MEYFFVFCLQNQVFLGLAEQKELMKRMVTLLSLSDLQHLYFHISVSGQLKGSTTKHTNRPS
jgi:hypothetical protein